MTTTIEETLRKKQFRTVIVFEAGFDNNLRAYRCFRVQLIADATDPNNATILNFTHPILLQIISKADHATTITHTDYLK